MLVLLVPQVLVEFKDCLEALETPGLLEALVPLDLPDLPALLELPVNQVQWEVLEHRDKVVLMVSLVPLERQEQLVLQETLELVELKVNQDQRVQLGLRVLLVQLETQEG